MLGIRKCRQILLAWVVAMLSACATSNHPSPNDPRFAPILPSIPVPIGASTGSIFQDGFGVQLWEDKRARRVGDILTIILSENTTSSKSSATNAAKDNVTDISAPTILGRTPHIGTQGLLPATGSQNMDTALNASRAFTGAAGTDQSNSLSGRITVTIAAVYPNGILLVRGEKWLTLTAGEEYIRVSGMVRPEDIEEDNTVTSSKLADARITYSGTGELADTNKMGWLSRFFMSPSWLY